MHVYIIKRLILFPLVWVGVSLLVFLLVRIVPGTAIDVLLAEGGIAHPQYGSGQLVREELGRELGLDKPFHVQFGSWVWGAVRGDLGISFFTGRSVSDEITKRIPVSLQLTLMALGVGIPLGLALGVVSAVRQDSFPDYLVRVTSIAGLSIPNFWLGTILLLASSLLFRWIPPVGYVAPWDDPATNLLQFSLPAVTLGAALSATIMRMTRSAVLETMRQDYIRTAWAKGLRERAVIYRHALKNALIPVITLIGLQMGNLLGGTAIVETVFNLPGVGRLTVESITHRDYAQLQGNVLFIATVVLGANLLVDLMYAWFDPRIRYS